MDMETGCRQAESQYLQNEEHADTLGLTSELTT